MLYTSCVDADWTARTLENFMLINPLRLARKGGAAADEIFLSSDFLPEATHRRSRSSDDLLWKRGLVDIAIAVLERTATTTTVLSLERSVDQRLADERLRRKVAFIAPHVKRAAAMGRALVQRTNHQASLTDALDKISAAVFLLDSMGLIVHANAAARRLLVDRRIVREVAGALVPNDRAGRRILAGALDAVRTAAFGQRSLPIPVAGDDDGLLGTLIPLKDGAPLHVEGRHRAAVILCIRPAITTSSAASFGGRYGLTRRELSVLTAIVEHGGIAETATALGLSEGTVKGYVKAIFQKTGARRQADLVRMVAGFASPFE